jgi:hypothetical protein
MTYSLTTPLLGAVEDDRVVFGRLLGAGALIWLSVFAVPAKHNAPHRCVFLLVYSQ